MAESLASLRKKGGGMTKTTLWTNPNPSSGMGEVTLTLSDDVNNYDYIGIHYQGRTVSTPYDEYDIILPIATYNDSVRTSSASGDMGIYLAYYANGSYNSRTAQKVTDTTIKISKRGTYSDNACAPLEIYGLK